MSWIDKEKDAESGDHNFGVRQYSDGRFRAVDPLWEKYRDFSPYNYSGNNPLTLKDPTGKGWDDFVTWVGNVSEKAKEYWDKATNHMSKVVKAKVEVSTSFLNGKAGAKLGPIQGTVNATIGAAKASVDTDGKARVTVEGASAGASVGFGPAEASVSAKVAKVELAVDFQKEDVSLTATPAEFNRKAEVEEEGFSIDNSGAVGVTVPIPRVGNASIEINVVNFVLGVYYGGAAILRGAIDNMKIHPSQPLPEEQE